MYIIHDIVPTISEPNFVPGLANIKVRSKLGFLAATSNARHAPTDSPTKYIGLFGKRYFSDLTVLSISFTKSETHKENALIHYKLSSWLTKEGEREGTFSRSTISDWNVKAPYIKNPTQKATTASVMTK